jgi:hypothetical protein
MSLKNKKPVTDTLTGSNAFFLPLICSRQKSSLIIQQTIQAGEQACLDNRTHHYSFNNQDNSLNVAKGIIL